MISVICPIFSVDDFLSENLNNLLKQDFKDYELKFIDYSSNDNFIQILKNFKINDKIEVFTCESENDLTYRINDCIKSSKGNYIYFWDSSYNLNKNAFSRLFKIAEENKADCLVFNYVEKINKKDSSKYDIKKNRTFFDKNLSKEFIFDFPISNGNNFILKSFLEENADFNGNFRDYFFSIRITSKRGMILKESLAKVNGDEFNAIESIPDNFKETISLFKWFLKYRTMFESYKINLLKYVLQQLKDYHDLLTNFNPSSQHIFKFSKIKKDFYNNLKKFFDKVYYDYKLYDDIKNLDDTKLVKFFDKFLINKGKFRFSVIIPVFNSENYLEETLNSIIRQTLDFRTIEVILVDDCSSDSSPDIMKKYSDKYDNFKSFFLEENSSYAGRPRNIALSHASSKFVSFLDADDYYYKSACETLYYSMIGYGADVAIGNYTMDAKNGKKKLVRDIGLKYFPNLKKYSILEFNSIKDNPHLLNSANVWNKMFKSDIIEKNRIIFPEGVPAQDTAFLFRYLLKSDKFILINKAVTHYHSQRNTDGDKSVTHRRTKLNIVGRLEVYHNMHEASLEADMEEHFVRNLLVNKLVYLFRHINSTDLPDEDFKEIFEKYSILYAKCIEYNARIPEKYDSIFRNIGDLNFEEMIEDLNVIKSE